MTPAEAALFVASTLGAQFAEDNELAYVMFICSSSGAAVDVVMRSDDLVHGISPLPAGCEWLPFETTGTIGETVLHVDTPGRRFARISRVTVGSRTGYSSGLVDLISLVGQGAAGA